MCRLLESSWFRPDCLGLKRVQRIILAFCVCGGGGSKSYRDTELPPASDPPPQGTLWTKSSTPNKDAEPQVFHLSVNQTTSLSIYYSNCRYLLGTRPLALRHMPKPKQCRQTLDQADYSDLKEDNLRSWPHRANSEFNVFILHLLPGRM